MIEWNSIKNSLDDLFNFSNEKPEEDYLIVLFDNLEKQKEECNTLPFKIVDIKEQGFKIKVGGLYGYISFYHMPWKYSDTASWKIVYPYLLDKRFFAKIFELIRSERTISIKLNGEIPQFKKPALKIDDKYNGIIIKKTNYGIFIDIGFHFDWKCGSIVGMIHKSFFENIETFENLEEGQILEVFFWGFNEKEKLMLGTDKKLKEWMTGEIEELVGDLVSVKVKVFYEESREFLVEDMYSAILPITKLIYPEENRTQLRFAVKNLQNEEIIHCEIIGIIKSKRTLKLKWNSKQEIEKIIFRGRVKNDTKEHDPLSKNQHKLIENRIENETVEKLNLLGKTANVEVIRTEDNLQNKYLVEGKYKGKLSISNGNYRISVKEKKCIEQNLQDGDIINCEVLSVEKKTTRIKWEISDEELSRFINGND